MHRFTFVSKLLRQGTTIVSEKEEGLASHKLLLQSGILSVSSPGTFVLSPIALRVVDKLIAFIDYKMSEVGGQKCLFPTLGRSQLWVRSGRWEKFGGEMFRLKDRVGRSLCLQPTHEEEACEFVSNLDIGNSVLPLRIYQISSKFRDEIKPRLGLLRCREFLMKDMYSFDLDVRAAEKTYDALSNAYSDIFRTLRLPVLKVAAEGGLMGDCPSHEFHCPLPVGEDTLSVCPSCNEAILAANADSRMCPDCGLDRQTFKSIELAHCFLLGDKYTSNFNVKTTTQNGRKILQMGCYGIGVTRLLAAALEHFTASLVKENPPKELRWPSGFAPYSGAIALQKDNARDALSTDELNGVLAHFMELPSTSNSPTSGSTFFAGLLPRGDILVDDRPRLTLGRKLLDLRRLGVPWILIVKSRKGSVNSEYELVDVNRGGISFTASLDDVVAAFTRYDFQIPLPDICDHQYSRLWHENDTCR
ncbi:prolyl tRNA synthetase mitochondrial [Echinococcus multilocularis]|uniref:proline--tRNA ligase n=1 Tax=Echinococcus multilocularis TaxID=6211 RepID=A0A068Y2P6_ECHMU|nr:prolyl tRNA synthetase mitochondrial [Echinococcus multilocularis]